MGKRYLIKQSKNGLIQIPMGKYTMLGEAPGIKPEEVKKIGDSLGVDWNSIGATQLYEGTKVESGEHQDVMNGNLEIAVRIALAHLKELPDYYTRLKVMEAKAKKPEVMGNIQNA